MSSLIFHDIFCAMNFALMLNFINCRKDSVRKLNTLYKVSLLSCTDAVQVDGRGFFTPALFLLVCFFCLTDKKKNLEFFVKLAILLLAHRHHDEKSKLSGCAPEAIFLHLPRRRRRNFHSTFMDLFS